MLIKVFLEAGDSKKIIYTDDNWQILEHCNRGYKPWWTLHKKRSFFGFVWWSSMQKWGDFEPLKEYVDRWNKWPDYT